MHRLPDQMMWRMPRSESSWQVTIAACIDVSMYQVSTQYLTHVSFAVQENRIAYPPIFQNCVYAGLLCISASCNHGLVYMYSFAQLYVLVLLRG